jgi:hypothetical protein
MKLNLSTVHYISIHSANLTILTDAATKDILIYGNIQPNFLEILGEEKKNLHSEKYSSVRHAAQGKCELNMTQSKGDYLTHL